MSEMIEDLEWIRVVLAVAIHAIVALICAWDLWAAATRHSELSVSRIIQAWSLNNPVLPLAVGVAMGHLFWPIK